MSKRLLLIAGALLVCGGLGALAYDRYRTSTPDYRLQHGLEAARAGDYSKAAYYADRLDESGQQDRHALVRGEIRFQRGDFKGAIEALNQIRGDEFRLQAADRVGRCLLLLGQPRDAEQVFRFLVEKQPDNSDAHRILASIYIDQGDFTRAIIHSEEVARLDPRDARPHRVIGLMYKDDDRYPLAVEAYRESLRRGLADEVAGQVRVELAECLLKLKKPAEMLEVLDNLDSAEALILRVEALNGLEGRKADAVRVLDDALKRFPNSPGVSRLQGERLLAEGKPADAAKYLESAANSDRADHRARYLLIQTYARLCRSDDAREQERLLKELEQRLQEAAFLSRAASENPWDPAIRLRLADLCDQLGRKELAAMWRRAAEACTPASTSKLSRSANE